MRSTRLALAIFGGLVHVPLGLQVLAGALLFILGIWICIRGFYRCGDALDSALEGNRWSWFRVGYWYIGGILGGAVLSSGIVTYGLSVCEACR